MSHPEASPLTIRVRLFASLRDAMGWGELAVTPALTPATPLTLWRQLELSSAWQKVWPPPAEGPIPQPAGDHLPPGLRVAINQRFATAHTPLNNGDELAFLPPITGG